MRQHELHLRGRSKGKHGHSHGVVVGASSQRQVKVNGGELDKQGKHLSGRQRKRSEWWVFKAIARDSATRECGSLR